MLPVCVMVPPPSPTFYCALFIYFVVFFSLVAAILLLSSRYHCVCVCDWRWKCAGCFVWFARPFTHWNCLLCCEKLTSRVRVRLYDVVSKNQCTEKSARARPFLLSQNRHFYSPACISLHTAVFFALSHRCCYYFYFNFGALFVGWYFLLFVVIENVYCEFYDFWNAANNNRIRFYVGRPMLVHSRWNCSWELTFFLSVVNVVAGVVSIVVIIIIINNVQPSICECAIWLLLF